MNRKIVLIILSILLPLRAGATLYASEADETRALVLASIIWFALTILPVIIGIKKISKNIKVAEEKVKLTNYKLRAMRIVLILALIFAVTIQVDIMFRNFDPGMQLFPQLVVSVNDIIIDSKRAAEHLESISRYPL